MPPYRSGVWTLVHRRTTTAIAFTLAVTLLGFGCTQTGENSPRMPTQPRVKVNATADRPNKSTPIAIAVIPWQVSAEQEKKLQPLADYLSETLGQSVQFQITKDYDTSVNLLAQGKVDLAFLGPLSYLEAKELNPDIEPIVAPIDQTTGRPWYTSIILANRDRGIETLEDLKGKRFAFVSTSSTSGYLIPMMHFKETGIDPDRDFAAVEYAGGHHQAKQLLLSGEVDAIADDKRSFLALQQAGQQDLSPYKIIWESEPIPNVPLVASSQLSPQLKAAIKKAFIKAPPGLVDPSGTESAGYTLAKDEDYNAIRKIKEIVVDK